MGNVEEQFLVIITKIINTFFHIVTSSNLSDQADSLDIYISSFVHPWTKNIQPSCEMFV